MYANDAGIEVEWFSKIEEQLTSLFPTGWPIQLGQLRQIGSMPFKGWFSYLFEILSRRHLVKS